MDFVRRCGDCCFAEGGCKVVFANGEINYQYNCSLTHRTGNIVFLYYSDDKIIWENQRACNNFAERQELIRRKDLDVENYDTQSIGYYELIGETV